MGFIDRTKQSIAQTFRKREASWGMRWAARTEVTSSTFHAALWSPTCLSLFLFLFLSGVFLREVLCFHFFTALACISSAPVLQDHIFVQVPSSFSISLIVSIPNS